MKQSMTKFEQSIWAATYASMFTHNVTRAYDLTGQMGSKSMYYGKTSEEIAEAGGGRPGQCCAMADAAVAEHRRWMKEEQ